MVQRLPQPEKEHPDPRQEYLDGPLRVDDWAAPGEYVKPPSEDIPQGAPSWWRGDEDASQSFFKAMGIDPSKTGQP